MMSQLRGLAAYDPLCGLPNRDLAQQQFRQAATTDRLTRRKTAVVFIDLDHFKAINDTFGHQAGDDVLRLVATGLREAVRQTDLVARWGGDEFLLLLPGLQETHEALEVGLRIKNHVEGRLRCVAAASAITLSLGMALSPDDGRTLEELLPIADRGLYQAKRHGGSQLVLGCHARGFQTENQRTHLRRSLASALREGQVEAWFQPVVDCAAERVVGLEVIPRWPGVWPEMLRPEAEPGLFVPGLARGLVNSTLEAARVWYRRGLTPDLLFDRRWFPQLNAVGEPLRTADDITLPTAPRRGQNTPCPGGREVESTSERRSVCWLEDLAEAADRATVPRKNLVLGVGFQPGRFRGESWLQGVDSALQQGFRISWLGVGTDTPFLRWLGHVRAQELWIGPEWTRHWRLESARAAWGALAAMASAMRLRLAAGGIEDREQLEVLRQAGCQRAQGPLWPGPLSAEQVTVLLNRQVSS